MSQSQPIIDRILLDAQTEADEILASAQARADAMRESAQARADALVSDTQVRAARDAEELLTRKRTVAALEVKKILLGGKRDALDAAFDRAKQKLKKMSVKQYGDFLAKLLDKYSEYGDEIVLAKECPVEPSFIMALKVYDAKKLRLSKTRSSDFEGGMMLVGKTYDKVLSFENLLAEARAHLETEVAAMLGE